MSSLLEKASSLEIKSNAGLKTALFWKNAIATHGEQKAEAFYKSLGLNHIERKGVEWEGLTLSREPTEAEKICVKGIAGAQETAKEKITKILLELRTELILDGLKGIKKLAPARYHELTLTASAQSRESLRDRLIKIHRQGRLLVAAELGKKAAVDDEDEFDDLDTLTDLATSRAVNDTQSRITSAAARWAMLGLTGAALWNAVAKEMADGSVSYIDRAAGELAHRVVGIGRGDEMRSRADSIERYEFSALLDDRVCENCAPLDGTEAATLDELPEVPLADCLGGGLCRCFIIAVAL